MPKSPRDRNYIASSHHRVSFNLRNMRAATASLLDVVSVTAPSVAAADHFARAVEALKPCR